MSRHIYSEAERRRPGFGHKDVTTSMVYIYVLNRGPTGVRGLVDMLSGEHGGLMPMDMSYGDKNGVLSQRLDISPVTPKVMLHLQASYTAIVAVFGVL